jgi:hypothetical protein
MLVKYTDALGLARPNTVHTIREFTMSSEESPTVEARYWDSLAEACKRQRLYWRDVRIPKLHHKITHPGGSSNGVRWIPLARYVGWPEYALHNLAGLIMNESSGRPKAVSPTNDHGLVQFNACWSGTFRRVMHVNFFPNIYDPELNLRFAYYVFHVVQGDSFLPAWRGDPAATFWESLCQRGILVAAKLDSV